MLTGSTIAAADMLNTTQPSVSRLLSQAQSASGLKLFNLNRGRLNPTPEAFRLFDAVRRHFLGLDQIEQTIAAMRKSGTGLLRIASNPTLGVGVVPRAIAAFHRRFADVEVSLATIGSRHVREGLLNGMHDVGITTAPLCFPATEFEVDVLCETEAVCVMSLNHPLAASSHVSAADFARFPYLGFDGGDTWREIMSQLNVKPPSVIETTYSATVCSLAAAGVGLGVVDPFIARFMANQVHIAALKPTLSVRVLAAYPRHVARSGLTTTFVEVLSDQFSEQDRRRPRNLLKRSA